ncbi:unnamed protein product [Tilletia laevis]|uniref:non-specific serine/threonine protein kinase n=2 Tax=Tilletia TaxID=13289 RepID=A0A177VEH6_9BASI|nr:hypothetical protein CF336_g3884 [Tilletia laevis]KAE8259834.1 hypothetical protein A4X03_0g3977 [Tilletia caries]KAE8203311.1 hypothetical protein CF335_g3073 [Tilletia laevis]CAD6889377.1 unnamed protein product [Tilletia caries]CAD6909451.1 unnamed protein product [Tilletia laevis]
MVRPSLSCPALEEAFNAKAEVNEAASSPAQSADPRASPAKRNKMPKLQDFPVPPKTIEIAFEFQNYPQQYDRDGDQEDATAAVLGTGAFGAAYRYVKVPRVDSMDESSASTTSTRSTRYFGSQPAGSSSPPSSMEEEILEDGIDTKVTSQPGGRRLRDATASKRSGSALISVADEQDGPGDANAVDSGMVDDSGKSTSKQARGRSGSVLRSAASLPQLKQHAIAPGTVLHTGTRAKSAADDKRLSSIVIKLCRTPITGSFDELPRHSRAAVNKPKVGWHVRIVRGEGRMFRYIQKAQALHIAHQRSFHNSDASTYERSSKKASSSSFTNLSGEDTNIVRLFADLPADGHITGQIFDMTPETSVANSLCAMSHAAKVQDMDSHSRPLYRMLVFEELVDLDAELVDGAWVRGTQPWTAAQVENAARDTAVGLRFLHAHAIVHSDLKPANLMRDPRTGAVKLIDLGAARRFVRIEDQFKHSTTIVEERDAAMNSAEDEASILKNTRCDGLTSLTGSPHFMAPEILLQATRYTDKDGQSRSTLKDYKRSPHYLPANPNSQWLRLCLDDYVVGWGLKSDIWSWGCCVLSFLVRMLAPFKDRNNTALICPFDFTFDDASDALHPLHELAASEKNLPHFHLWARIYPLRIQDIVAEGARITAKAQECMSPSLTRMVVASLRHHTVRPTAEQICDALLPLRARSIHLQHRHSISNIDPSSVPESLKASISSKSAAPSLHGVPAPVSQVPVANPPQPTVTAQVSTSGLLPAFDYKEGSLQQHQQVEMKELPAKVDQNGKRFSFYAQPQTGAVQPAQENADLLTKQPEKAGNEKAANLPPIAPALGLQLGNLQNYPTTPRKETKETQSSPAAMTHRSLSELLTPPETPRESQTTKTSAIRRRLSSVSAVNLRLSNVMSAMHLTSPRERPESSSNPKQLQRLSTGGKVASVKSNANSPTDRMDMTASPQDSMVPGPSPVTPPNRSYLPSSPLNSPVSALAELDASSSAQRSGGSRGAHAPSMRPYSGSSMAASRTSLSCSTHMSGRPMRSTPPASPVLDDFLRPGGATESGNGRERTRALSIVGLRARAGSFVRRAMTSGNGASLPQAQPGATRVPVSPVTTRFRQKPAMSLSAASSTSSLIVVSAEVRTSTGTPSVSLTSAPQFSSSVRHSHTSERSVPATHEKRSSLGRMSSMLRRRSGTLDKLRSGAAPLSPEPSPTTGSTRVSLSPSRISTSPSHSGRTHSGSPGHGIGLGIQLDPFVSTQGTGNTSSARLRTMPSLQKLAQRYGPGRDSVSSLSPAAAAAAASSSNAQDTHLHAEHKGKTLRSKMSKIFQRSSTSAGQASRREEEAMDDQHQQQQHLEEPTRTYATSATS